MGGWRTRLFFSLILYCTGFLTAVYLLAPSPAASSGGKVSCQRSMGSNQGTEHAGVDWQDRAATMRAGMDKAFSFAEDNADRAIQAVKAWIDQRQSGQ